MCICLNCLQRRRRRSYVTSSKDTTNANVGVSGLYEVISEADLAFTPDKKQEIVTVFQGKIREEIVYGICLPIHSFNTIFLLMAICAILSAIVAGFWLCRYQVHKRNRQMLHYQPRMHHQQRQYPPTISRLTKTGELEMNSLGHWIALRFIGSKQTQASIASQAQHIDSGETSKGKNDSRNR